MSEGIALAWFGRPLSNASANGTRIFEKAQSADMSSHIASDLAHTATGLYVWEAAQFIFFDLHLLCTLLRGACPSAVLVITRLRARFFSITSRKGRGRQQEATHTENLELQMVRQGGLDSSLHPRSALDIGVESHTADREMFPAPQAVSSSSDPIQHPKVSERTPTFMRFCNFLAKFVYLLLRFTTFASLVTLLVLLDFPSQTPSPTSAPRLHFTETLTCEEWKVLSVTAWVATLAGFCFGNVLLILRTIAVWLPQYGNRATPVEESQYSFTRLRKLLFTTFLPILFFSIHAVQWVLVSLGAERMSHIPTSAPGYPGCAFAPPAMPVSVESAVAVIHRKRALMPPGFGIGAAFGSNLGDPKLIVTICAYFLTVDIFAFSLLVIGITRRSQSDSMDDRRELHMPTPVEISVSHSVATSHTTPNSATPTSTFLTAESKSDKRGRANSTAESTISMAHFVTECSKVNRSQSNILEGVNATQTQTFQSCLTTSDLPQNTWRWIVYDVPVRSRLWRIWIKQGLFWVVGTIIAKLGLLVCVIFNATPAGNSSLEFQTMCMCVPIFVVVSIASGRLFLCVVRSSGDEEFVTWNPLPTSYALHSGLREALDSELGLPSYVDQSQYFRRITRADETEAAVLQTIGGTEWNEEAKRKRREMKRRVVVVDEPAPAKVRSSRHRASLGAGHRKESLSPPKSRDRSRKGNHMDALPSCNSTLDMSAAYTDPGPSSWPGRPAPTLTSVEFGREVTLESGDACDFRTN